MVVTEENIVVEVKDRVRGALLASGLIGGENVGMPELTDNAIVVLLRRYLSRDREGQVLEGSDGMFRRVAHNLALADVDFGVWADEFEAIEEEFYEVMRNLEFLPNSPTLMNAGRELQQLSACFVLPVDDSLDSIFERGKANSPDP